MSKGRRQQSGSRHFKPHKRGGYRPRHADLSLREAELVAMAVTKPETKNELLKENDIGLQATPNFKTEREN